MTSKTKFKSRDHFREELREIVEDLLENYCGPGNILTKDLVNIEAEGYHFIGQLLKPPHASRTMSNFCSLLYKNVYKAELLCAGAGEMTFLTTLCFIKTYFEKDLPIPEDKELNANLEAAVNKIQTLIESISGQVSEYDLWAIIDDTCANEPLLASACWQAINLAGLEGRVFIENGKQQDHFVVELKEGYTFPLKPYKFFLDKGKWESRQCKVLIVDGFIESVSEIDQILNEAHDKKQPVALISHGFSEEVVSTLYTNFKKKTLNVIPLRLMSDISSLNVINDIGVVCGMDPISSLKGELLTFVKYENLPVVERMLVSDSDTTIENFKTRQAVFAQIKALLTKRENNQLVEDIQNLIDGRIRSLAPNAVTLRLPAMDTFKADSYRIKLDRALRQTKTLLNYGIIKDNDLNNAMHLDSIKGKRSYRSSMISNKFEESFFEIVEDITYTSKGPTCGNISALCFYAGLLIGSKLAFMFLSANGAVQRDG